MSTLARMIKTAERLPLPDAAVRLAIAAMVARTERQLAAATPDATAQFAATMATFPIATNVDDANDQHYEIPSDYFQLVLGPRRKYSCCLYADAATTLAAAEEQALAETVAHAQLADGQDILELGCGWGSLSIYMAQRFPTTRILAVSNSHSQRTHIVAQAARQRLANLEVMTADINRFATARTFDRVVSVEMFEHMANWQELLRRIRTWLRPDGKLMVHVFAHRSTPYRFDRTNAADWIAQHFFTGGLMPSRALMHEFPHLFRIEDAWWWNGTNYARTAQDWLVRHDANADEIMTIFTQVYGTEAALWAKRWRYFYLATAGLFGHNGGKDWGVAHYRMQPVAD